MKNNFGYLLGLGRSLNLNKPSFPATLGVSGLGHVQQIPGAAVQVPAFPGISVPVGV